MLLLARYSCSAAIIALRQLAPRWCSGHTFRSWTSVTTRFRISYLKLSLSFFLVKRKKKRSHSCNLHHVVFSTRPCVFHTPGHRTPWPRPRVFYLALLAGTAVPTDQIFGAPGLWFYFIKRLFSSLTFQKVAINKFVYLSDGDGLRLLAFLFKTSLISLCYEPERPRRLRESQFGCD